MPGEGTAWWAARGGLRFSCTQCGNCCTGAPGYVRFTDEEASAMSAALGIGVAAFMERYTHDTPAGRSLTERRSEHGLDCVFLDRRTSPGRALCRVYAARPSQCRTWPFWEDNLRSEGAWERAKRTCPGMDRGELHGAAVVGLRLAEDVRARRADGGGSGGAGSGGAGSGGG